MAVGTLVRVAAVYALTSTDDSVDVIGLDRRLRILHRRRSNL
jgi:hypothetical protein